MDIFDKIRAGAGSIAEAARGGHGYYAFPELQGDIGPRMIYRGRRRLVWSLNNYLGLANHPAVREADIEGAMRFGMAAPMGSRMMSGETEHHLRLESELAEFVGKPDAFLVNFGYQAMVSLLDTVLDRRDVAICDSDVHACIMDGLRLHSGKRLTYPHNDIDALERLLARAVPLAERTGGGVLVISEGVFGMAGDQGRLAAIVALKKKYPFRLLVDDAHGFGVLGAAGGGTGQEQAVQDGVDIYFGTFAKSMASIGAFIAGSKELVDWLKYNMRSQIFSKGLPTPLVWGALKRLSIVRSEPERRARVWEIARALQGALLNANFDIGRTNSLVTPVLLSGGVPQAAAYLRGLREKHDIFCSVVVYPVVPKDTIMFRLIPTADHSLDDVRETVAAFVAVRAGLASSPMLTAVPAS
jgi:glycine C-acetyltransferase